MRAFILTSLTVMLACVTSAGVPKQQTASQPSVAVLPMANESDPQWISLTEPAGKGVESYFKTELSNRGFNQLPSDQVLAAVKDVNVDFSDPQKRDRKAMFDVGDRLHADYIVLVDLIDIDRHNEVISLVLRDVVVSAHVKVWLLDGKSHEPIIKAKTFEAKADGLDSKASELVGACMSKALSQAFKDFFKTHPVVKH